MTGSIEDQIQKFTASFPPGKAEKDEILFRPEEQISNIIYLKEGYVKMYGLSADGVETTIHIFVPFTYFPLISVLGNIPNRYYLEALTPIRYQSIPSEKMIRFLKKNPEVLFELTGRILRGLDKLTMRIEHLSYEKADIKVRSALLYLAAHFGEKHGDDIIIKEIFTHKDIASLAGLARETMSREWKKLEQKGIVKYQKKRITVNVAELQPGV